MTFTANEINEARKFFQASDAAALASDFVIGSATWFSRNGQPSIHRENVFGYEPTYNGD